MKGNARGKQEFLELRKKMEPLFVCIAVFAIVVHCELR